MKGELAVQELLKRGVGTAIIFIELVHGCNNTLCPSWGKVCHYTNRLDFMSETTLDKILNTISDNARLLDKFDKVDVWPYGCGDPTKHPQLSRMLHKIHDRLPYPLALSIDSNSFVEPDGWDSFCRAKIMHKQPKEGWLENAERWNHSYNGNVQHGFITNHITTKLWNEIKSCGGIGTKKGRTFLTINFGGQKLPSEISTYQRVSFTIDPEIPVERRLYTGALAKRAMFSWDGSLRRCLVSGTTQKTFSGLLEEPIDSCAYCFSKTGGELINFYDDKVVVEEFACCVSDRPL